MTATVTFSGRIDATNETDLASAAVSLTSYVATYGNYDDSSDYTTWETALGSGVTAGNNVASIQFGERVFFIEYNPAVANVEVVQYGSRVILIETLV